MGDTSGKLCFYIVTNYVFYARFMGSQTPIGQERLVRIHLSLGQLAKPTFVPDTLTLQTVAWRGRREHPV